MVAADCQELGILHDPSLVEIKKFDLGFGWQGLVRNDAHVSEDFIERIKLFTRNSIDVIKQSGLQEEVCLVEVSEFLVAFLQEAFI